MVKKGSILEPQFKCICGKEYKYAGAYNDHIEKCNIFQSDTPKKQITDNEIKIKKDMDNIKIVPETEKKQSIDSLFNQQIHQDTKKVTEVITQIPIKPKPSGTKKEPEVIFNLQAEIFVMMGKFLNTMSDSEDFTLNKTQKSDLQTYLTAMGGAPMHPLSAIFLTLILAWGLPLLIHFNTIKENVGKKGQSLKNAISNLNPFDKNKHTIIQAPPPPPPQPEIEKIDQNLPKKEDNEFFKAFTLSGINETTENQIFT